MDGDPSVESQLDSFSRTFPLPYRAAFITILAVWGWGMNLHYLHSIKIDVPALIRYPGRTNSSQLSHHQSAYRLGRLLSITSGLSLVTFWLFTRRDAALVVAYDWLPMLNLAVLAALFSIPLKTFPVSYSGRGRTLGTLKRISIGGLAEAADGKFGDILLADVLTSYAKVFGDLYVCLCMFLTRNGAATARPDRSCGGLVMVPLIMAVPSAIRLRQCLIEYVRVRKGPPKESAGWGGQHLANALKYATAFPVIVLSACMRNIGSGIDGLQVDDHDIPKYALRTTLYRAWLVAVLVNSLYSFYWDVAKDWDLTLLSGARERNAPGQPFGLRRRLLVHRPGVYYLVIALDLMLRCTWSLKLSPHLDHVAEFESSIFIMEFLEVFRRWIWIFFRVEAEWIRNTSTGLDADDFLLGNFSDNGDKYQDDED